MRFPIVVHKVPIHVMPLICFPLSSHIPRPLRCKIHADISFFASVAPQFNKSDVIPQFPTHPSPPPFSASNFHPLVYLPLPPPNLCSVSVGLMVAFVDVELVGFLYWAGLSFNSVTSINLLIAVGVAVDYSTFYAFSFMTKVGTRTERAEKALCQFGVAVFNGGFTLFLAVLPLALSQSYIFITFFKVILSISKRFYQAHGAWCADLSSQLFAYEYSYLIYHKVILIISTIPFSVISSLFFFTFCNQIRFHIHKLTNACPIPFHT